MIGGQVIEIIPYRLVDRDRPGWYQDVIRLWVIGDRSEGFAECCVYAEPSLILPRLRSQIWWQSGKIFFNDELNYLKKVGYSFDPARAA